MDPRRETLDRNSPQFKDRLARVQALSRRYNAVLDHEERDQTKGTDVMKSQQNKEATKDHQAESGSVARNGKRLGSPFVYKPTNRPFGGAHLNARLDELRRQNEDAMRSISSLTTQQISPFKASGASNQARPSAQNTPGGVILPSEMINGGGSMSLVAQDEGLPSVKSSEALSVSTRSSDSLEEEDGKSISLACENSNENDKEPKVHSKTARDITTATPAVKKCLSPYVSSASMMVAAPNIADARIEETQRNEEHGSNVNRNKAKAKAKKNKKRKNKHKKTNANDVSHTETPFHEQTHQSDANPAITVTSEDVNVDSPRLPAANSGASEHFTMKQDNIPAASDPALLPEHPLSKPTQAELDAADVALHDQQLRSFGRKDVMPVSDRI